MSTFGRQTGLSLFPVSDYPIIFTLKDVFKSYVPREY